MQGLYLKDADQIASGKKTALATAQPHTLTGTHLLIAKGKNGYSVLGSVEVGESQAVTLDEFDTRVKEHGVSLMQRRRWWPNAAQLTLHPLSYSAFPQPQPLELTPPSGKRVTLAGLGLIEIAVVDDWHIYA